MSSSQFIRAAKLIVSGGSQTPPSGPIATPEGSPVVEQVTITSGPPSLDLSQFRFTFRIFQSDFETPNSAEITVYNLSDATASKIRKEYTQVTLQAGYRDGNLGVIFTGTIKQAKIGRENPTDTYLNILAADSDLAYNFGTVNTNIPAGTTPTAQAKIIAQQAGLQADDKNINFAVGFNQANIRGKVMYGMARTYMRNLARSGKARWSIQNGSVVVSSLSSYSDTEAVVINSKTGMINLPEQTEDGVRVTVLLNPLISPGTQVKIDEKSVQRASVSLNPTDPSQFEAAFPAIAADGFYTVLVVEHEGDMRGNPWYSTLTCLSVDKTQPAESAVKPYG